MSYALNNFTGGEFGDRLRYRVDLAKYRNGCRVMENFFPMPWGGVENRPGMVYLAPARSTGKILLIPFQFNVEQAYLIEATDRAFRFFRDGEVLDGHITTPYLADELEDLCWTQSNDVLFLAHPNHPPAMLSRITTTSFRYETITGHSAFRAPFMDENSDGIAISYTAYPSGGIAISSSDALFVSSMEGAEIKWSSPISGNAMGETFTGDATGAHVLRVKGAWTLTTGGSFVGTIHLEKSSDGKNFGAYRSYTVNAERNIQDTGYCEDRCYFRLRFSGWGNPPSGTLYECRVSISMDAYEDYGVVRITKVNSPYSADGVVLESLPSNYTTTWSFSAWDACHGFPALVQFYSGDRLVFARTAAEPTRIWLSAVGDYLNFEAGTNADEAMLLTIKTGNGQGGVTGNAISFLGNRKELVVGSWAEIGSLKPKDESSPLAPDNKQYLPQTSPGGAEFPPLPINDVLLFVRRGGENLMELSYNYMTDGYQAPDLTILRPEILSEGGGIKCMAMVQLPYPVVYCLRHDGVIATFTYNRSEEVTAWARQVTDGIVESIAVLQDPSGYDRVYVAVRRGESMNIEELSRRDDGDTCSGIWLDAAKRFSFEEAVSQVTATHLAGMTVSAIADGVVYSGLVVSDSGVVTLPEEAQEITVGLPYVSTLETLPLEIMQPPESTFSDSKKNSSVLLKYYRSSGGSLRNSGSSKEHDLVFRRAEDLANGPIELKTGTSKVVLPDRFDWERSVIAVQRDPFPLTILGMVNDLEAY